MAYEPGKPEFNPEGFSPTDRLEEIDKELEDTGDDIFAAVNKADAINKNAEEIAKKIRDANSPEEEVEQKKAA